MRNQLLQVVRAAARSLETTGLEDAKRLAAPVREEMTKLGLVPDCHCWEVIWDRQKQLERYAGQLLSIVDGEAWFAMNSWLNCVDKFAPEESNATHEEK